MKKAIILALAPMTLLASCSGGRNEINVTEFTQEAATRQQAVAIKVNAGDYPFTKYTMKGDTISASEVNSEYTYETGGNWFNNWDYEYKGSGIPSRVQDYEMFSANVYLQKAAIYMSQTTNTFKFFKEGNNLLVEAKYVSQSSNHVEDKITFDENGYATKIFSKENDTVINDLTLVYSK